LTTKDNILSTKEGLNKTVLTTKTNKLETKDRIELLYEKGRIKNEVNRLLLLKTEELRMQKELSNCTFHPQTNKRRNINTKNHEEGNFFERLASWNNKINKKYDI